MALHGIPLIYMDFARIYIDSHGFRMDSHGFTWILYGSRMDLNEFHMDVHHPVREQVAAIGTHLSQKMTSFLHLFFRDPSQSLHF